MRTWVAALALVLLIGSMAAVSEAQEPPPAAGKSTTTMLSVDGTLTEVPNDQVPAARSLGFTIEKPEDYQKRMKEAESVVKPDAVPPDERVNVITPEGKAASLLGKDLEAALARGYTIESAEQKAAREARARENDGGGGIGLGAIVIALVVAALVGIVFLRARRDKADRPAS